MSKTEASCKINNWLTITMDKPYYLQVYNLSEWVNETIWLYCTQLKKKYSLTTVIQIHRVPVIQIHRVPVMQIYRVPAIQIHRVPVTSARKKYLGQ